MISIFATFIMYCGSSAASAGKGILCAAAGVGAGGGAGGGAGADTGGFGGAGGGDFGGGAAGAGARAGTAGCFFDSGGGAAAAVNEWEPRVRGGPAVILWADLGRPHTHVPKVDAVVSMR